MNRKYIMKVVINGVTMSSTDGKLNLPNGQEYDVDFSNPSVLIVNTGVGSSIGFKPNIKNALNDVVPAFIHNVITPDIAHGTCANQCRVKLTDINQTAIIIHPNPDTIKNALSVNQSMGCTIESTDKFGYYKVTTKPMKKNEKEYEKKGGVFAKLKSVR